MEHVITVDNHGYCLVVRYGEQGDPLVTRALAKGDTIKVVDNTHQVNNAPLRDYQQVPQVVTVSAQIAAEMGLGPTPPADPPAAVPLDEPATA